MTKNKYKKVFIATLLILSLFSCSRTDFNEEIEVCAQNAFDTDQYLGILAWVYMDCMASLYAGKPLNGAEGYVAALSKAGFKQFDHVTNHMQLRGEFAERDALKALRHDDTALRFANMGDWLEIHTNDTSLNGFPNHSGMYVTHDYYTGDIIILEADPSSRSFVYMLRPASAIKSVGCVKCLKY